MRGDISVSVSTGVANTYVAISNDKKLMVTHKYAPGLDVTIHLGPATKSNIQAMQDCLERLKIHASDG